MNDTIHKARTIYDMLFTFAILAIGVVTCILSTSGAITIMGVTFIIAAIVCWFILKSGFVDKTTMQRLSHTEVYYAVDYKSGLLNAVMNEPSRLTEYPRSAMNSIKLDIFYNDEDAYVQMFEYVPCNYQPCTRLMKHKKDDISSLIHK